LEGDDRDLDSSSSSSDEQSFDLGKGEEIIKRLKFEKVEMVVFPLGTAILIFYIDWLTDR